MTLTAAGDHKKYALVSFSDSTHKTLQTTKNIDVTWHNIKCDMQMETKQELADVSAGSRE